MGSLEYIKHETGEFDEECVFHAKLQRRNFTTINGFSSCVNLRWLDLSHNQIFRMENLEGLTQLLFLDLSYNKIPRVQSLEGTSNLERLRLQSNPITRLMDLDGLRALDKIKHLQSQHIDGSDPCPVCEKTEFKRTIYELCPSLVSLDSKRKHLPDLEREIRFVTEDL